MDSDINQFTRKIHLLNNYWYLDSDGIRSLVSQCSDYLQLEKSSERSDSKAGKIGIRLAVKALAAIFGSASINTHLEQNTSIANQESYKFIKETENYLDELLKYLKNSKQLFSYKTIDEFLTIDEKSLPLFCIAEMPFLLDKDYYLEKSDPYSLLFETHQFDVCDHVKKENFILLKGDLECNPDVTRWRNIVLGGSLSKWTNVYKDKDGNSNFGLTSHLGILLRESVSSPINFNFFGHITKMGLSLYIKPYAIWNIR